MNRTFEDRKSTKVYAKSRENKSIIQVLDMYGRVPEQYELLEEIERLNNIINELEKYTIEQINIVKDNMQIIGNEGKRMATRFVVYNEYLDKLKSLKEGNDKC